MSTIEKSLRRRLAAAEAEAAQLRLALADANEEADLSAGIVDNLSASLVPVYERLRKYEPEFVAGMLNPVQAASAPAPESPSVPDPGHASEGDAP